MQCHGYLFCDTLPTPMAEAESLDIFKAQLAQATAPSYWSLLCISYMEKNLHINNLNRGHRNNERIQIENLIISSQWFEEK